MINTFTVYREIKMKILLNLNVECSQNVYIVLCSALIKTKIKEVIIYEFKFQFIHFYPLCPLFKKINISVNLKLLTVLNSIESKKKI